MSNPFRRRPPTVAQAKAIIAADMTGFRVPPGDVDRRRLMAVYRDDPSAAAGEKFWRLAWPDLEAGFLALRRQIHEQNGWTP